VRDELKAEGETTIKREEFLEKLDSVIKGEAKSEIKPNWKDLAWERTKKLAKTLIRE
jgi:hypothetical protein